MLAHATGGHRPTLDARTVRTRRWGRTAAVLVCLAIAVLFGGCATTPHTPAEAGRAFGAVSAFDSFALLRDAADHEALYTLAGGLKPMSSAVWRGSFTIDDPDLADLRGVRAALAPLRNDIWYADVQVFDASHEGKRSVQAFVVHRAALARMIERFADFWNTWGITPCTHPSEIVAVVDRMPKGDRWRGYGYLFGYPSDAVDFFVEAGLTEGTREVGPGKDRRFIHIPTYAHQKGRFTYAVPLEHATTPADQAIAAEATRILTTYTDRRRRMRDTPTLIEELRRMNRQFEPTATSAAATASPRSAHTP